MTILNPVIVIDPEPTALQIGNDAPHKAKRRSRNEVGDRNFTCGCGKSYLSYPALYTHIKTKHEGVAPEGTTQRQSGAGAGRGRPKKEEGAVKSKEGEDSVLVMTAIDEEEDKEEEKEKSIDLSTCIDDLKGFLSKLSSKIEYEGRKPDDERNHLVAKEIEVDATKHFPLDIFTDQEEDYRIVYDHLKQMRFENLINEEAIDPKTQLKQTSINRILAIYIYEVSQHITKEFYREFVFFMLMYRRALNKIGWEAKIRLFGRFQVDEAKEFCETNNGEYIPEICNEFIGDLLPEYMREYDIKGFKVIGFSVSQTSFDIGRELVYPTVLYHI